MENLLIMRQNSVLNSIDLVLILLYFSIIIFGCLAIYSSEIDENTFQSISFFSRPGKHLFFLFIISILIIFIQLFDYRFIINISFPIYLLSIFLLLLVLIYGTTISGSTSWISIYDFRFQPSEFAKFTTALFLANYLENKKNAKKNLKIKLISLTIIFLPFVLILSQGDFGTAFIFFSFIVVLYRYNIIPIKFILILISFALLFFHGIILDKITLFGVIIIFTLFAIGIFINNLKRVFQISVFCILSLIIVQGQNFILENVLEPRHKNRIISLFNPNSDPLGSGWNVSQSKIAIGSGGLFGNGYLQGTQTRFDFVPEQSTDFIFSVIGEEFGFIGSLLFIILYSFFLFRLLNLAEIQKDKFSLIYGYSVFSLFFFHYSLNIAMSMGLFPVIGIPLPLVSYGGSSIISFSILFFVFIKLNSYQPSILRR